MAEDETEQAISEFLGDERAGHWRQLRKALEERRADLRGRRDAAARQDDYDLEVLHLDREIATMTKQIEALRIEEAVSEFVEDSIRVTIAKHQNDLE